MSRLRTWRVLARDMRGAALVEFAVAAPVLILLMLGIFQIGIGLQANSALRELMGWAGRTAMVAYQDQEDGIITASELETRITERVARGGLGLRPDRMTASVEISRDEELDVQRVAIHLAYELEFWLPFTSGGGVVVEEERSFFVPL